MELITERLVLRPFTPDDWAGVHAYASDPEVVRHMDWGPNTPEDTTIYLDRIVKTEQTAFAIVREGQVLGAAEIQITSLEHGRAEMGYVLARAAWGHGYATEAAAALLRHGFGALGVHKISATCDPENTASAHVLAKIGMHQEGHLTDHFHIRGTWRDRLLWAAVQR
jgi:RimJ/RimL family protein N-acetyltransferase